MKEMHVLNKQVVLDSEEQALFYVCWVFHQTGWNHKAVGKRSRAKDCGLFNSEHMKQPNYQMCLGIPILRIGNRHCSPTILEASFRVEGDFSFSNMGLHESTVCHAVAVFS